MKILDAMQRGNRGPVCKKCRWFQNDPALLEEVYPGFSSLSSGFAAVRDRDGFCNYHQLYLSATDHCPQHSPRST
jgi:hypothetical protein